MLIVITALFTAPIFTQPFPVHPPLIKRYGKFIAAASYAWEKISYGLTSNSLINRNLLARL